MPLRALKYKAFFFCPPSLSHDAVDLRLNVVLNIEKLKY